MAESDSSDLDYNETVLDHFRSPRNSGDLPDANAIGEASNPAMQIRLLLRIDNGRIDAARFQTKGCPASIATSSVATEWLTGKPLEQARAMTRQDLLDALGGLPRAKHHCPALVEKALAAALAQHDGTAGEPSMAKSSEADPSAFVELAAAIPLEQLNARSDLSTTFLEAAAAYIGAPGSAATIADALADVEQPWLTTALLAVEASLGLSDAWIPLSERVTTAGGLTQDDAERLRAVRLTRPAAGERSAYRGAGLVGIAVRASFSDEGATVDVQVALGGVSRHPQRASAKLIAVAAETAVQEARPAGVGSLTVEADLAAVRAITLEALRAALL